MKKSKDIKLKSLMAFLVLIIIGSFLVMIKFLTTEYVAVYFIKTENQAMQLVGVAKPVLKDESNIQASMKYLIAGPTEKERKKGFSTEIPEKTVLLGIKETPKDVTINLSKDFESGGGSLSMTSRLAQVSFTALDATDKPVYFELDGKKVEFIGGEGVEVEQPLRR